MYFPLKWNLKIAKDSRTHKQAVCKLIDKFALRSKDAKLYYTFLYLPFFKFPIEFERALLLSETFDVYK